MSDKPNPYTEVVQTKVPDFIAEWLATENGIAFMDEWYQHAFDEGRDNGFYEGANYENQGS